MSWHDLWVWSDQSNWANVLEAMLIPTVPLALWTRMLHRRTRRHTERHHASLHERLDRLFGGDDK